MRQSQRKVVPFTTLERYPAIQQTPKAFANFSPRLELATTLGLQVNSLIKPCKGSAIGERFQRFALISDWIPMVVAALQP